MLERRRKPNTASCAIKSKMIIMRLFTFSARRLADSHLSSCLCQQLYGHKHIGQLKRTLAINLGSCKMQVNFLFVPLANRGTSAWKAVEKVEEWKKNEFFVYCNFLCLFVLFTAICIRIRWLITYSNSDAFAFNFYYLLWILALALPLSLFLALPLFVPLLFSIFH